MSLQARFSIKRSPMWRAVRVLCLTLCTITACGKASATEPERSYAGTYATRVSVTENACGSVTVMDMPTAVTHTPSTGAINLLHAGTNYPGTVKTDSTFTTTAVTLNAGDGNRYLMTIAGKFSGSGFDALVTLDRTTISSGATCRYIVRWIGTR